MIVVDTSVWVDFFNYSSGSAGTELERLISVSEQIALTGLILTEVLQGLTRNVEVVEEHLSRWPVLEPQSRKTYEQAAEIFRLARAKGSMIATVDAVITAIALENRAEIFTLDKDFARISQLTGLVVHQIARN